MSIRAIASAIVVAGTLAVGSASAMPLDQLKPATEAVQQTENVRWVCGPYRCWWRPNYYYGVRPYWGPRRFYGGYGRGYRYGGYGYRRW